MTCHHGNFIACRLCAIEDAQEELESIPPWRLTEFLRRHRDALCAKKPPRLTLIRGGKP